MHVKHFSYFLSCLAVLCVSQSYSAGEKGNPINVPSAQEWRFHKFGDVPVDYYTGTASVSIPIYTYKDHEFEIPLSLNYASNGYMPNIPTDVLGLGWYLNGIGGITRTIYGLGDDFGYYEGSNGSPGYRWGAYYFVTKIDSIKKINLESYIRDPNNFSGKYLLCPGPERNECKPDVYFFKFPGHKGKFQLAPMVGHKYKVYDSRRPWGEYAIGIEWGQVVQNTTIYQTFDSFSISTGDGYKYAFGGKSPTLNEHSTSASIANNQEYNVCVNYEKTNWPLTTIVSPSERMVKFNYEANTAADGMPRDDYYDNYQLIPDYDSRFFPAQQDKGYQYVDFHEIYTTEDRIQKHYQSRIKTININNKIEITFLYISKREEICQINGGMPLHNRGLIGEIHIDRINEGGSRTRLRSCKLNYVYTSGSPVALLKSVEISGEGTYQLKYYHETANFPIHGKNICDPWGFYNKTGSTTPSPENAMFGMLEQITYPTQGYTRFDYEGHDYGHSIAKDINDRARTFLAPTSTAYSGGLRIKKIINCAAQNKPATQREFRYIQNGESSGISLAHPRYIIGQVGYNGSVYQSQSVLDAASGSYMLDRAHIEYATVTEVQGDGSKKIFYFSNYQDTPDENYISGEAEYKKYEQGRLDDRNPISLQTQRGKLLRLENYDDKGHLLYCETNLYDKSKILETNPSLEYNGLIGNSFNPYVKKSIIDDYLLKSSSKIYYQGQDSLVFETDYAYNSRGQLIRTQVPDGNGNTIVSEVQYIADIREPNAQQQRMIRRNMLSYPYKKQVSKSEKITTPGSHSLLQLVSGERYNYYDFNLHFMVTPFPLTSISSTNLPRAINTPIGFAFDEYLEEGTTCKYNRKGNLIQTTDRSGVSTTYVWGHDGVFLLAKIVGVPYQTVVNAVGLERFEEHALTGNLSQSQINALYALNDAQVSIYEYDPYIGIMRSIDPSRRETHYTYDSDGKLSMIGDDKKIPTQRYEYHIKTR